MQAPAPITICFLISTLITGVRDIQAAPALDDEAISSSQDHEAQTLLLDVTLNGVASGVLPFIEFRGNILIPAETARYLRIRSDPLTPLDPALMASVNYLLDRPRGAISLEVLASQLTTLTLETVQAAPTAQLSPESLGMFVNYDISVRQDATDGQRQNSYGAFTQLNAFAPDFKATSGWTYDQARSGVTSSSIRLDSVVTWRPATRSLALSLGDIVSTFGAAARPWRFLGIALGTDHSAEPGWTSLPVASVAGTAQSASSIDIYINGLRRNRQATAGGPFTLALPSSIYGAESRVVVTDVTGRVTEIPLEIPKFSLNLIQHRMALWSAGLGRPRFSWGSVSNDYLSDVYGYGTLRYGVSDRMTLTSHIEGGPGLIESEAEFKWASKPWLGVTGSIAQSRTRAGHGVFQKFSTIVAPSNKLFLTLNYGRALHDFNDAVSWSGKIYDLEKGTDSIYSQPVKSTLGTRISWQIREWLALSASYQRQTYADTPPIQFSSWLANIAIAPGASAYLSVTRGDAEGRGTNIMLGFSFTFGRRLTGSVSASKLGRKVEKQAQLSRPLGQSPGDVGWQLSMSDQRQYIRGEVEARTGYGIESIGLSRFAGQSQRYFSSRGSAGMIASHLFFSDPIHAGIVAVEADEPNIKVLLNGVASGRTGHDGKTVIPVHVAGTPQRIALDVESFSLETTVGQTQQLITVRESSGSTAKFDVQSISTGVTVLLLVNGQLPPVGAVVLRPEGNIPIDKDGRAWIPSLEKDAWLTLEMVHGQRCIAKTGFNGQGGPNKTLGPINCEWII